MAGKTISSLNVVFGATISPFVSAINGARSTVGAFMDSIGNAGSSILRMTGIAGGIGAAFGAIKGAASGIGIASQLEQTEVAFTTMLRSGDAALGLMSQLTAFASETPFEFPEIASSAKSLLAFGVSAGQIQPKLRAIGDISAGVGAPIGEIAELFGKAKVAGTLYAEDINQLVGRGIPVIQQFAKQLGVSESQVKKMASEGKITFGMLDKAFTDLTSSGGQFEGMMAAQSKTLGGLWSTFTDNVGMGAAGLVTTLVDAFSLKDALSSLSGAVGTGGAWLNRAVKSWAPTVVGGMKAIGGAIVDGFARAWDTVSPFVTRAAKFFQSTTSGVIASVKGASVDASDALAVVIGTVGLAVGAWATWNAAILSTSATLAIARGTVIAFDGAMVAVRATTSALTATQAGLAIGVAGVTAAWGMARAAGLTLSGVYASGRAAVVLLTAANAGLSFMQAAVNTATIAGGVAQLAFATIVGTVRGSVAGLTATQVIWRGVTLAGTAAQWLLNAALTANPIGLVVVALGALVAWGASAIASSGALATAFGGVTTACDFASFTFQNFGLVARLAFTAGAYELTKFANLAVHFFTVQTPAYLSWFASNWRNVFTTAGSLVAAIFTNMGTNVAAFFRGVRSWLAGDGFDFKWTALTTGFESTMSELPKIAERQIGPLETQLGKQFADVTDQVKKGFADYRKGIAREQGKAQPEPQPLPTPTIPTPEPFKFPDAILGIDTKPADAALDKTKDKARQTHDAIANIGSGSAEQWQRIARAQFAARTALDATPASAPAAAVPRRLTDESDVFASKSFETPAWFRDSAVAAANAKRGPVTFGGSFATPEWLKEPAVQQMPVSVADGGMRAVPVDRAIRESAREQPKRDAKDKPLDGPALIAAVRETTKAVKDIEFEIVEVG